MAQSFFVKTFLFQSLLVQGMLFRDVLYHLPMVSSVYRHRRFVRVLLPVIGRFLSLVMIHLLREAGSTCGAVRVGPEVPAVECKEERPADEERRDIFAMIVA